MLQCMVLMGSLFLSDGEVMVDFNTVSGVEKRGQLLLVTTGGRETRLDASAYPADMPVEEIVLSCAARAQSGRVGMAELRTQS